MFAVLKNREDFHISSEKIIAKCSVNLPQNQSDGELVRNSKIKYAYKNLLSKLRSFWKKFRVLQKLHTLNRPALKKGFF